MNHVGADIQSALQGSHEAFRRITRSVEPEIRRILTLELRSRGDVDLEEAVQEVLIYMNQKLHIYNPEYTFETFVRGLTRTIALRFKHRRPMGAPAGGGEDGELTDEAIHVRLRASNDRVREIMGFKRVTHPAEVPSPSPMFLSVLELLFAEGGYPHQQIAFGFNLLLFGKKKRTVEKRASYQMPEIFGDPARVVQEIGPMLLPDAVDELETELQAKLGTHADIRAFTRPLLLKMELTGEALFAHDPTSLRHLPGLRGQRIGDTRLLDYFGKNPRKSVTDWTHTVSKRLKAAVGAED